MPSAKKMFDISYIGRYADHSDIANIMNKARRLKLAGKTGAAKSYKGLAMAAAKQSDRIKRGIK